MPLPATVDFHGDVGERGCDECDGRHECDECDQCEALHRLISNYRAALACRPDWTYCCWDDVTRGLAFLTHSFDQFSISATVCSTDSRAA